MAKYRVYLVAEASRSVVIEAASGDEAVELAFEGELPYAPAFSGFDLGEWTTASEMWHGNSKPEDDYELIEDL